MNFLDLEDILELHLQAIERFGGSSAIRDQGLLESALASPQNLYFYEDADAIACAAGYGYALCQNHPCVDGNKRIAAAALEIFLLLHDWTLHHVSDEQLEGLIFAVASHSIDRNDFEARLRALARPIE